MATLTMNEDQKRRGVAVLDALYELSCAPYRPLNAAILITVASGVITTVDIAQAVTTKTLSGTIDDQAGVDWTGP